jgi:predicted nucleotide-binding protein (sugar kinase/HSP70/actin superfamily)
VRALSPTLTLTDRARLEGELLEAFGELLELDADENRRALEHALLAQRAHQARLRRRGLDVLARARAAGRPAVVVLARPYHADPGVQHGVSTELAARGLAVLGISSLPLESAPGLDLSGTLPSATNSGSAERAWAARVVAASPGLYAAELSSFRCGQDASAQAIVDELLGDDKPALRLHDIDEHRPALSMRLRIETFVEAVERHHGRAARARDDRVDPTEGARA